MPSDRFWSRLSNSLGSKGLRTVGKLNVPVYRLTRGRVGGKVGKGPVLLLTTTGRKSGQQRTHPLIFVQHGDGWAIVASKGGAPDHPAWYLNLTANPEVEVQVRGDVYKAQARTAQSPERELIWAEAIKVWPDYDTYQARTERQIPVVVLEPRSNVGHG